MKLTNYSVLCGTFFLLALCPKNPAQKSKNPPTQVVIDANGKEWASSFYYNSHSQLMYAFSNDDQNLYICLKVNEEHLQHKVLRFGLTTWFDTTGSHKEHVVIKYPMSVKERNIEYLHNGKGMQKDLLKNNNEMEAKGLPALKGDGEDFVRLDAESVVLGTKAKIGYDSVGSLIYELQIPFKALYGSGKPKAGKELGIRFTTGAIPVHKKPNSHYAGGSGVGAHAPTHAPGEHKVPHQGTDNFTGEDPVDMKITIALD